MMNDQRAKILCVDDEPNILSALKRVFRANGYLVFTAESGQEGLEILRTETIDLVISDMRMPGLDGIQFLEQVRSEAPHSVRILLTGYSEIKSIQSAIERGDVQRYIPKPWDDCDILLIVKLALEHKCLIDEKNRLEEVIATQNKALIDFATSQNFGTH